MKDGLIFVCFTCIFIWFLAFHEDEHKRQKEVLDSIKKVELKIDSLQTKYNTLQNTIIKHGENNL